jgi:two-component system phosphate regulon sensor histidine kinase PhoR
MNVSHAIRNHLTIIQSYLEILHSESGSALDDDQLAFLGAAYDNALQLGALVEDLVLIGALETGIADLEFAVVELGPVLDRLCRELQRQAASQRLALECAVDAGIGALQVDPAKFEDAIRRILDNAIRFTPAGGRVRMDASRRQGCVEISIIDTGVGIAARDLEHAFDIMTQLHRKPGEPRRGHGLGLPVARHIIRAFGGEVRVASEVGVGSTFVVRLPSARDDACHHE